MRISFIAIVLALAVAAPCMAAKEPSATKSTRKERLLIKDGNRLYKEGKYTPAAQKYEEALRENPMSLTAVYDLGLTRIRQSAAKGESEENREKLKDDGAKLLESVAASGQVAPHLASKAAFNLGNLAFHGEKYDVAVQQYKRALRIDPDDDDARRNLRIAQKKLQNQQQDKDQDKNKDKDKNKDQEKKDQDKDQNQNQDKQDQNKDQNQNQDKQDQKEQQQPPQSRLSEQTAAQILQAVENKENATRARVGNIGDKSHQRGANPKNW